MERARTLLLYADDNADDRMLVTAALAQALPDVTLQCMQDGQALLEYLEHTASQDDGSDPARPSAILLDHLMPRKDGFETLAAIRSDRRWRHLPVILVSTSARPEDVQRAYDLGASAFVRKPRSHAGLIQVLRSMQQFWKRHSGSGVPAADDDLRRAS